ncbi:restriction endonuclease [Bacillus cereus]|uniref:restriction endonuclease n=1 Tax=Bacillus cereus TaxID=1396 RepID=UPI0011A1963B|nr:restriction endonuclease [Bacillus cereus]
MWGFFKWKKSVELSKEEKIEINTRNKEEVLQKSRELLSDFQYDFEFVSEDLEHVLILDKLSRKIAFIQLSSLEIEPTILALKDVNGLGIYYDFAKIGIERYSFENFGDIYNLEKCASEIDFTTMSTMNSISIYIKYELDYVTEEEIILPFYKKGESLFYYEEKHEELKGLYEFLIRCIIEDENLRREESKIKELKSIIEDLCQYKNKNKELLDNQSPLLKTLLSGLVHDIPYSCEFGRNIFVDIDKLGLSIKGFRMDRLYIDCNFEAIESLGNQEIRKLIIQIIELQIQNYGYKEVKLISSQSKLDELEIKNDVSVQEQIVREVIEVYPEFYKESYKSYVCYQETLFIYYDKNETYNLKSSNIKWDKNKLSILEYLIGDQTINVVLVPSNHKIQYYSMENIEEIWRIVVKYTIDNGHYSDYSKETLLASKAYAYKDQVLSIYNVDRPGNLTSDLIDNIKYAFYIYTGQFVNSFEIKDNPEKNVNQQDDEENVPLIVTEWIKQIESQPHTLFDVFDFRDINSGIYVFLDHKLYVANLMNFTSENEYQLPKEPWMDNLTKRSLRINSGYLSLGECHFGSYHEKFATSIRQYLIGLDQVQKNQMKPWKQKCMENNTIQTLFERFYQKKVKPFINATYLDDILDDVVDLNDEIETFSQLLMKRNYIEGDEFLIGVFVRECVVKSAIKDFSETFKRHNGLHFENIANMTLTECLQAFHAVDFASMKNQEDLASFMCFLLQNNKIELDVTYQDLQEKLTEMLMQDGEEQMLQDYESDLLAEDEDVPSITIEDVDEMDGYQFEEFVAQLFQEMGYKTEVTSSSGDYGIDVIAKRKGLTIGIQAKRYSDKVSNKAVQEVIAGIAFYNLDQGLVITNNYYTKPAQNQAKGTSVLLWDRDMLLQKLREVYGNKLNLDKSE